jgi:hypothetical protein
MTQRGAVYTITSMHWLHFFKQKGEVVIASNVPDGWTRVTTNVSSSEGDGQVRKHPIVVTRKFGGRSTRRLKANDGKCRAAWRAITASVPQ